MCKINLCVYDSDNIPVKVKNEINSIYITRMTNRYDKKGGFLYKLFLNHFDAGSKALEQLNNRVLWFILNLNDSPIAFMAAFTERDHKTLVIPRLAISDKFNQFSPGILLLNESIKYLLDKTDYRIIDLIHGNEKYKFDMGGTEKTCCEIDMNIGSHINDK